MHNDAFGGAPQVPERVPTLTEVIEGFGFGEPRRNGEAPVLQPGAWRPDPATEPVAEPVQPAEVPTLPLPVVEVDGFHRALTAVLDRIEVSGEARLREALVPLIAHFTDGLVAAVRADLRRELASALRDPSTGQLDRPPLPQPDRTGADVFSA